MMPVNKRYTSGSREHWRRGADAAISLADDMKDEISKQMMLQITDDYERLIADDYERLPIRAGQPVCADESDAQVAAPPMARALKPDIIRPLSGTEQYSLCAMEQNSVVASDGKLLLAAKVIAAVIAIIGIALLAFPDPMRKLVDSSGRTTPLGSAAHLATENQKGLTTEPLPLGTSVTDGSGGETVTLSGLTEGTELSLGTKLGSDSWLVSVADLDKVFVAAPMNFVGVMTGKVTLNSATGKGLDTRNIRFEWSKPELYSAASAGQTEPTQGSTPRTSGRAELRPAPGAGRDHHGHARHRAAR